jgi:hypothetical protein
MVEQCSDCEIQFPFALERIFSGGRCTSPSSCPFKDTAVPSRAGIFSTVEDISSERQNLIEEIARVDADFPGETLKELYARTE